MNQPHFILSQALSLDDYNQPLSDQSDHSVCSSSGLIPNAAACSQSEVKGQRFSVRYLGSHPVEEGELVPGECVKVVHASIRKTNSAGNVKVCFNVCCTFYDVCSSVNFLCNVVYARGSTGSNFYVAKCLCMGMERSVI